MNQSENEGHKVEFLLCGSPNDAFYSQMAFFRLALDYLGGPWAEARVVAVFGDEVVEPLPERWKPHFGNIEVVYADPEAFRRSGFYAASDLRFELVDPDADLSCLCDADTAFIDAIPEDLLDDLKASPAIIGVMAHVPAPIGRVALEAFQLQENEFDPTVKPIPQGTSAKDAWEQIGDKVLGRTPELVHRYSLLEPTSDERGPFYINYGFLGGPPGLLRKLFSAVEEVRGVVKSMVGNAFFGQVAITMAAEKHHLPVQALPLRFNYPNDRRADRLHTDELENLVMCHYLRHTRFDRHRIFASEAGFDDFLAKHLVGSDRLFQTHVRRVTGGAYPFSNRTQDKPALGAAESQVAERHEKPSDIDWKSFYQSYPLEFGTSEHLKQAGHTIQGEPISEEQFEIILADMRDLLDLQRDDRLLDLCCGNGVFTRQLSTTCKEVLGVDFSEPLLDVAERDHAADNLHYYLKDVSEISAKSSFAASKPIDKVMMCAALQHFEPAKFRSLLQNLMGLMSSDFRMAFILVPDRRKKWEFYDTALKREAHLKRVSEGQERMGNWWHPDDVEEACSKLGLRCSFHQMDQRLHTSQYRFHILISP